MALGRKTGGRQSGSLNLRTKVAQQALVTAISAPEAGLEDVDAITLLRRVYRNPAVRLDVRIDCAKATLKHETPSLASVEQKTTHGEKTTRIEVVYVDRQKPVNASGTATTNVDGVNVDVSG